MNALSIHAAVVSAPKSTICVSFFIVKSLVGIRFIIHADLTTIAIQFSLDPCIYDGRRVFLLCTYIFLFARFDL